MNDRKQITAIVALGTAALFILASAVMLGNSYNMSSIGSTDEQSRIIAETNKSNDTEAETEIIYSDEMSGEPLFISSENTDETLIETDEVETDAEQAVGVDDNTSSAVNTFDSEKNDTTETAVSDGDNDINVVTNDDSKATAEEQLISLLDNGAPLRWARKNDGSGEFVKVYPELSFAYYDIESGTTIEYNADTIRYAASLIKAPYIYSVLCEIEQFEKNKHDFDADGNPLYDKNGSPLFEGKHPNYDDDGNIIYLGGEEKYNFGEKWVYDSSSMYEGGSSKISEEEDGFELTWLELIDYALLYSDNIAFAQLKARFGYECFYEKMTEIGITDENLPEMYLSADDCVKFMLKLYDYLESGSELAENMKECMINSKHPEMISDNYESCDVVHKYGWDLGAFHDMAIIYDEHPYIIVLMTDYEDGGEEPLGYFADVTDAVKAIHAEKYYAGQ